MTIKRFGQGSSRWLPDILYISKVNGNARKTAQFEKGSKLEKETTPRCCGTSRSPGGLGKLARSNSIHPVPSSEPHSTELYASPTSELSHLTTESDDPPDQRIPDRHHRQLKAIPAVHDENFNSTARLEKTPNSPTGSRSETDDDPTSEIIRSEKVRLLTEPDTVDHRSSEDSIPGRSSTPPSSAPINLAIPARIRRLQVSTKFQEHCVTDGPLATAPDIAASQPRSPEKQQSAGNVPLAPSSKMFHGSELQPSLLQERPVETPASKLSLQPAWLTVDDLTPGPPPPCSLCNNTLHRQDRPVRNCTEAQLKIATDSFAFANQKEDQQYKGSLGGEMVYVVLKGPNSSREIKSIVDILEDVRHPNVVKVVGYCDAYPVIQAIVYGYICNRTISFHLSPHNPNSVSWPRRMMAIIRLAEGLTHLHDDCGIIHGNFTSASIYMDHDYVPIIGGFNASSRRRTDEESVPDNRSDDKRFRAYRAPECALEGKISDKTDVYAFGVVSLEVITGLSLSTAGEALIVSVIGLKMETSEGTDELLHSMLDPRLLRSEFDQNEWFRILMVARQCISEDYSERPIMTKVLKMLTRNKSQAIEFDSIKRQNLQVIKAHFEVQAQQRNLTYPKNNAEIKVTTGTPFSDSSNTGEQSNGIQDGLSYASNRSQKDLIKEIGKHDGPLVFQKGKEKGPEGPIINDQQLKTIPGEEERRHEGKPIAEVPEELKGEMNKEKHEKQHGERNCKMWRRKEAPQGEPTKGKQNVQPELEETSIRTLKESRPNCSTSSKNEGDMRAPDHKGKKALQTLRDANYSYSGYSCFGGTSCSPRYVRAKSPSTSARSDPQFCERQCLCSKQGYPTRSSAMSNSASSSPRVSPGSITVKKRVLASACRSSNNRDDKKENPRKHVTFVDHTET